MSWQLSDGPQASLSFRPGRSAATRPVSKRPPLPSRRVGRVSPPAISGGRQSARQGLHRRDRPRRLGPVLPVHGGYPSELSGAPHSAGLTPTPCSPTSCARPSPSSHLTCKARHHRSHTRQPITNAPPCGWSSSCRPASGRGRCPRLVNSLASPTRPECAVTRRSTLATSAAAVNRNPIICDHLR